MWGIDDAQLFRLVGDDLCHPSREDVVDESSDGRPMGEQGLGCEPFERAPDAFLEVVEAKQREVGFSTGVAGDLGAHLRLSQIMQPTSGVLHDDDFLGPEETLGEKQGPKYVVGDDPAGVTDNVSVPEAEP